MEVQDSLQRQKDVAQYVSESVSKEEVTIILPVLNEETAIRSVIQELTEEGFPNIMVVDGYSTDATLDAVHDSNVQLIQQHGRGKTGAITTALDHARTPYILLMDGDFTYAATDIKRLLAHGRKYDEIIGARTNGNQNIIRTHRFGNKIITEIFNLLMGTKFSDVLSGMYLLKTESARTVQFETTGFAVEVEIASQIAQHGTITEVPISYRQRMGKQKLSTWKDGPKILATILHLARKYNPTFLFSIAAALTAIPAIGILSWVFVNQVGTGVFHLEWALAGVALGIISTQALAVSAISLVLKRVETRINSRLSVLRD
jgi:dolichol-phosphate hexosyltransferase